jgi:hypothetical protein
MRTLFFIATLFLAGCTLYPPLGIADLSPDTPIESPVDTIIPEPFVFDTCSEYITIDTPQFFCFYINFDCEPENIQWYYDYDLNPIDLNMFLSQYGVVTLYESGQNMAGLVDGTANLQVLNGKVYCKYDCGARHTLVFSDHGLYFRGALTFAEYWSELIARPSVKRLNFANTGYTCDEVLQVLHFLLEDCKAGNGTIDLRPMSTCGFPSDVIEELLNRNWIILQ